MPARPFKAEITNNAVNVYSWTNLALSPDFNPLSGIRGKLFDLKAQFTAGSAQTIVFTFQNMTVAYNASTRQISCNGNTQSLPPVGGNIQFEILDRFKPMTTMKIRTILSFVSVI